MSRRDSLRRWVQTRRLAARLPACLARAGRPARVTRLKFLSHGWESDIYALDVVPGLGESGSAGSAIVLRLYSGQGSGDKAAHEHDGLSRLYASGYRVPRPWLLEADPTCLRQPFLLMDRIEGEGLWPRLDASPPAESQRLLHRLSALLAELHTLDPAPFSPGSPAPESADPYAHVDRWLARAKAMVERYPATGLPPVVEWLAARRDQVPCLAAAVNHGDFHPYNVLIGPDGQLTVVDWTGWEVTDPRFDLAWTLTLADAYDGPETRATILAGYEQHRGIAVEQLEFFEACAVARRLFVITSTLAYGAESLGLNSSTVKWIRAEVEPLRRVYSRLTTLTGLRLPEVEKLLA